MNATTNAPAFEHATHALGSCTCARCKVSIAHGDDAVPTVATTIAMQLTGRATAGAIVRLQTMIGATLIGGSGDCMQGALGIVWRARAAKCINACLISLDTATDTYTVQFLRVWRKGGEPTITTVERLDGIYCDQLAEVFERTTGLYLSLGAS